MVVLRTGTARFPQPLLFLRAGKLQCTRSRKKQVRGPGTLRPGLLDRTAIRRPCIGKPCPFVCRWRLRPAHHVRGVGAARNRFRNGKYQPPWDAIPPCRRGQGHGRRHCRACASGTRRHRPGNGRVRPSEHDGGMRWLRRKLALNQSQHRTYLCRHSGNNAVLPMEQQVCCEHHMQRHGDKHRGDYFTGSRSRRWKHERAWPAWGMAHGDGQGAGRISITWRACTLSQGSFNIAVASSLSAASRPDTSKGAA